MEDRRLKSHESFVGGVKIKLPNIKIVGKYKNSRTKIKVIDEIGVEYLCTPQSLLSGTSPSIASAIDKQKAIEIKIRQFFPKINLLSEFVGRGKKVLVENEGIGYLVSGRSLMNGRGLIFVNMVDKDSYFKDRVKQLSPELNIIGSYVDKVSKIEVQDTDSVEYMMSPSQLLLGHKPSRQTLKYPIKYFMEEVVALYGDKYKYGKIKFGTLKDKIAVGCKIHGNFNVSAGDFLQGSECPECAKEKRGWEYSRWVKAGLTAKRFDGFKVYIIKVFDDVTGEVFIKIGKSFETLKHRFGANGNTKALPYNYSGLREAVSSDGRAISVLENKLHQMFYNYKHIPNNGFKGDTECFNISIEGDLLSLDFDSVLGSL